MNLIINEKTQRYIIVDPKPNDFSGSRLHDDHLPLVSFCIPTLNNEATLEACLRSIQSQKYPNIEIIIVDGGSTDKTLQIAREYTSNIFFDFGKLGSARQTSIEHSKGEILALFDSDIIIPHESWLKNSIKYFNYSDKISTVWPVNIAPPQSPITTKFYFNQWESIMNGRVKKDRGLVGGGNSLFIRAYFEEIGGVDRNIHWGEDFDWAGKLKKAGYQVVMIKDPLFHDTMRSFKTMMRKQFIGAQTFTSTGFEFMGLSNKEIINEQFVLSIKGMIIGIFKKRDLSWLILPPFLIVRLIAYGWANLKRLWNR